MKITKDYLQTALQALNFNEYTEIQKAVIPSAIKKRDIIACSPTGTGKTHSYLIPIFEHLDEELKEVQSVILSPTRELASQIYAMAQAIVKHAKTSIDIRLYIGGKDRDKEVERLKKSQPQIVIGTPGKINDLAIKTNVLKVYKSKKLIIDEADMALEIGFLDDIDAIARTMNERLQMMVFSATISENLKPFLRKYLNNPLEINYEDRPLKTLDVTHQLYRTVDDQAKLKKLSEIIDTIQPYLAMVFVNKKEDVERVMQLIYPKNKAVVALHGDLQPRKRKQVLRDINNLNYQYIVATDIASRGIDIEGVSHIINYDLPKDMTFFIHRIGRTARMGASGESITFYTDKDTHAFDFFDKHNITLKMKDQRPKKSVKSVKKPSKSVTVKKTSKTYKRR